MKIRDEKGNLLKLRRRDFPKGDEGSFLWRCYKLVAVAEECERSAEKLKTAPEAGGKVDMRAIKETYEKLLAKIEL